MRTRSSIRRDARRSPTLVLGAALLSATVALAACGSDGTEGSAGKNEIVIGAIGAFSSATGSKAGPAGLDTWVKALNETGGIDGRKVKLIVKDSGSAATANVNEVRELIETDDVVAILDLDSADGNWMKYAEQRKVPVISDLAVVAPMTSSYAFPVILSPVAIAYLVLKAADQFGDKMGVGYCSESPACAGLNPMFAAFGESTGVEVAASLKLSSTAPDYTAACQQFAEKGVSSYFLAMNGPVVQKIVDTCSEQGVEARPILLGSYAAQYWKSDKAFDGVVAVDGSPLTTSTVVPAVVEYRTAFEKYHADLVDTDADAGSGLMAWAAGKMFEAGVAKVSGDLTRASLYDALGTISEEDLGGIIGPVTYEAGKPHPNNNCGFFWQVKDGKFDDYTESKPQCAPQEDLAPIIAQIVK